MAQCLLSSNPAAALDDLAQWLTLTNQYPKSNDWFPQESVGYIVNAFSNDNKLIRIPIVPLDETDSVDVVRYAYLQGMHLSNLSTMSGSIIFADYNYSDRFSVHVLYFEQAAWTTHDIIDIYNAIDDVDPNSYAPVRSSKIYEALNNKQDVFVGTSRKTIQTLDELTTYLSDAIASNNYSIRFVADGTTEAFLNDSIYFVTIYKSSINAVAHMISDTSGQDIYMYGSYKGSTSTWSWDGPYWVNPPYSPGKCYLLAESTGEGVDLYGMYLIIELDAGTNETKVVDLYETLGGSTVGVVVDFSYHVDNYLTEFNSVNEYIEIQHGSTIVVNYTTTKSHTVYLKMKFLKGSPQ